MRPEELYEIGYRCCARCGTRRPPKAINAQGECVERWWCDSTLPNCKTCGEPVPQLARGRRRATHEACKGRKSENVTTARTGAGNGIGGGDR